MPGLDLRSSPADGAVFATTLWTMVLEAGEHSGASANAALAQLCTTYWPPLYAFLRREGRTPHEAEDLVQGFFQKFLECDYLRDVNREKGRFRSFLLASVRHYAANERRSQRTHRRGGQHFHISLDAVGASDRYESVLKSSSTAEVVFDRVWAQTIMETASRRLREEYEQTGRSPLYGIIRRWLAREATAGEYAAAGLPLGITEGALAVAVHRMRQRFRQLIRSEVAHTVRSPADVEDEMRYLLRVLTG
jgi:RNA polymerase sigma-70 factor (ECF subfamily)